MRILFFPLLSGIIATLPFYDSDMCGRKATFKGFKMTDSNNNTGYPTNLAPWAVVIKIDKSDGSPGIICGGTLVTSKHVITAAHCFRNKFDDERSQKNSDFLSRRYCSPQSRFTDDQIMKLTKVTVGAMCSEKAANLGCTNEKQLGVKIPIKRFSLSTFFDKNCENGNDLAILELEKSVENVDGSNHACLPFEHNLTIPEQINVTSFGWGSDPGKAYDNAPYPLLQVVGLESTTIEECNDNWGTTVSADSFCTVEEEEKNVCKGDSGGGLTYHSTNSSREHLIAVVSFGTDCGKLLLGTRPKSQINTSVMYHSKFIRDFISQSKA